MRALPLLTFALLLPACQPREAYVTRAELADLLAVPPATNAALDAHLLSAFTPPNPSDAPTTPASALAAADRRLAQLVDALRAIDASLEVCARNLANVETTAYKAVRPASAPAGGHTFVHDFEQGSLAATHRQLDVAVSGPGFLKVLVTAPDGSTGFAYTRNGNLFVDLTNSLTVASGENYCLEPKINLPLGTTEVTIAPDGRIEALQADSARRVNVGQIQLAQFVNPHGLTHLGGALFAKSDASGDERPCKPGHEGTGQLLQGFLEQSNVDPTRERLRIQFLHRWRTTILQAVDAIK